MEARASASLPALGAGGGLGAALPRARELALLLGLRAATGAAVWASGFRALSDDDYARTLIAERFAEAPSLDPSGTSWLPLPFWLYGSVLGVFGTRLEVARALALLLGALSTLGIYVAARSVGSCRPGALIGAALGSLIPHSARLGIVPLPELPVAASLLLAAASLGGRDRVRLLGAFAVAAATLSRYEAWPVAAVFAALTTFDALRRRDLGLVAAIAISLAGPLAWLVHGRAAHGSAWFFIERVTAYRAALGAEQASLFERLSAYPRLLASGEPELFALALCVFGLAVYARRWPALGRYGRLALVALGLLVFLIATSVRGGAPTHHAERALLFAWLCLSVFSGDLLAHSFASVGGAPRAVFATGGALALAAGVLARARFTPVEGFADRALEIEMGEAARELDASGLCVDTPDFGFFAVLAAFGRPSSALVVDDHDPRKPRAPDPFASAARLDAYVHAHGVRWIVAPLERAARAGAHGELKRQNRRFALLRWRP